MEMETIASAKVHAQTMWMRQSHVCHSSGSGLRKEDNGKEEKRREKKGKKRRK